MNEYDDKKCDICEADADSANCAMCDVPLCERCAIKVYGDIHRTFFKKLCIHCLERLAGEGEGNLVYIEP